MNKKLLITLLLSSSAMMMIAAPASAVQKNDKTDVGVSFKSDGPVNPGETGPFKGNLSLIWKPSKFMFGEQKALANKATFNNKVEGNQYIVANDDRSSAESTAWKLSAQFTKLSTADGKDELASNVSFVLGTAQSYNIGDAIDPETNDFIPNLPESPGALGTLNPGSGITVGDGSQEAVVLEAGNTTGKTILEKKAKNDITGGVATKLTDVKLTVMDSSKAQGKSYSGQVIWTMDDLAV
ncbi:MAG: WxL domain-containing protein [Lactobacillales bacterium]|jgi:hypothetical protein|nr:WxL domain-containing protein [Lactobacillales bacterium]